MTPLVVLGTAGHAREVSWIARAAGTAPVLGCVGPRSARDIRADLRWLGDDSWLDGAPPELDFVIGVGSGELRDRLDSALLRGRRSARPVVHPAAVVGAAVELAEGSIIWPGAVLTTGITVGRHVHVTTNASVGHDAVLADHATLLPGCTVAGGVRIGRAATVGAGAAVLEGREVGAGAIVGAGAVVTRDVRPHSVVAGVPARALHSSPTDSVKG